MTLKEGTSTKQGTTTEVESFAFTKENLKKANAFMARYPEGRHVSAVLPLLDLAQRQCNGWLPKAALQYVAHFLNMPEIRVWEVVTFYTMFNLKPVGQHFLQVCTTTPCWLRGAGELVALYCKKFGVDIGETTPDGCFTLKEVECLGACVNAPIVQINDDFFEDLDEATWSTLLDDLAAGKMRTPGSAWGRCSSEPWEPAQQPTQKPTKSLAKKPITRKKAQKET